MLLARAKFVQTAASLAYLPYSSYQYSLGTIDSTFFGSTVAMALAAPVILAIFSRYLNRLVGVVAMSSNEEWARFGYLTFWGRRKNQLIRVDDLLPLSETTTGQTSHKLVKICWYGGGGDYLFLPTTDCDILNAEKARQLFGEADFLKTS